MRAHAGLRMLRVFCHVYETKSVSLAADRCSLSQSAASYLLAQLREQVGDPLFTRSKDGMVATPFSERLHAKVKPAVEAIDQALSSVANFDPATSERVFRIAMSDIGEMQFIPELLRHAHRDAPEIMVETKALYISELAKSLRAGEVDFAIGFLPELIDKMSSTYLFDEKYVCLYSPTNTFLKDGVSLKGYIACPHVEVVSSHSNHNVVSRLMQTEFAERKIGLKVAHYASVPIAIANTDMVVTVPSRIAKSFSDVHPLAYDVLPFEAPSIKVHVFWCDIFSSDPGHAWMRSKIVESIGRL